MKKILVFLLALAASVTASAVVDTTTTDGHPHVLVTCGDDFRKIADVVATSEMLQTMQTYIFNTARDFVGKPVQPRELKGRRMLNVSVECYTRIFFLAYAYRVSGIDEYADRAITEMLSVASFVDWHPEHFLDTAEMMCAMGIGYDWLYHKMSVSQRETIRKAIIEKGLKPSLEGKWCDHWRGSKSNWNQVCNGGCTLASLAVIDTDPQYARQLIPLAVETLVKPMKAYNPDGAYREGPGYWCYGTAYNCLFLEAVEKYYGTDYGLLDKFPVFLKTVDYHLAMMTPTYEVFCYADQAFPAQVSIAPFYMYDKTGNTSYLYMLERLLRDVPLELARCRHQRTLPAALVFAGLSGKSLDRISKPENLWYVAQGATPVAAFRSDWESRDALYIGLKCGSPGEGHNHMDEGSFYIEADGVRWAVDLGGENYSKIEKAGVDLWSYGADAGRWRLLRTGMWGHSCLILNSHDLDVKGRCKVDSYSTDENDMWACTDMSSIYGRDASHVSRTVALRDRDHFEVIDSVTTSSGKVKLRWQMATEAVSIKKAGKNMARLVSADGKTLLISVESPQSVKVSFHKWSAEPYTEYESKNPGRMFVGFTTNLKANTEYTISTTLTPGK